MLTRELKPTAGSIQVYGHDISSAWNKARRLIGLCPQQTVLFPFLTVQETLEYYSMLKESTTSMGQIDTNMVLHNMGLFYHRDYLVCHLSEGLSRRLSMAIAFTGNSKLIILDEPTAGVDPAARSAIWEVISNNRAGRTILLTTHHLDEAETLADRVAILHQGRLLCVGSPLALKSEYGLGYSLTLSNRILSEESSSEETADLDNNIKPSIDGTFSVAKKGELWQLLKSYVPNVRLLESVNGEVTYSLPLCDNHGNSNRLSDMFGELEKSLEELGFASLEIRPTSLEDVVIALNTINSIDSHSLTKTKVTPTPQLEKEENLKNTFNFKPQQTQEGVQLGVQRFFALLLKRLLHHGRDWRFYVQMLLLPQLFIILALIGSKCRPVYVNPVALKLTPDMYSAPTTTFTRTLDPTLQPLSDEFLRLSVRQKGSAENWSTCPSHVADYNPGLPHCNVSASNITSLCKCDGERCAVEVADQPSLNDWLLGTRQQHIQSRYGGVTLGVEDPRLNSNLSGAMVWYDNSGYHALPAYLNMLNNARLQRLLGEDYSITVVNKPILFSAYGLGSMSLEQRAADIGIGLLILVSLTVVCSATAGYIVAERVRGERRVLFVAGITRHMYWNANMLWDIMLLLMNVLLTTFILLIFNEQLFIWRENLAAFTLLAILFGLSILPLFYLVEGFFQTEASAVFFFFCSTFGIGFITTLLLIVCEVMKWVKELKFDIGSSMIILTDVANVMKYVFLIFPPFTFACGIKDLAVSFTKTSIMASFDVDVYVSPFSWDTKMEGGLGLHYLTLALWTVIGIMVLHCWHKCLRPIPRNTAPAKNLAGAEEDKDVAAERIKIQCGGTSLYDTVLRLVGLGRDFSSPPTTAVSNLFLALRRGECFSLLGLNGAGKTTAFRCLTGDIRPTRGQILVNGLTLEEALALPYPIMSYCPQTHALDPNLTSREALSIMALIRGFPQREIAGVLEQVIKQLGLSGEDNTIIKQLSGGTKRKLSTALTLLGNPLLVLLDEPTTGMDPASRRLVWRAIQSVTQDGRSVLLTSHSMDEVNQLSHRMAIMVNGYFVCMGSPHYLKHKLGDKYTIRLKTNDIEDMTYVVDFLRSQLQDVLLKEQHHLTLVVEVSRHLPLRLIFDTLNSAKSMGVTEYDVSQTTLNEVFRVLTSHQGDGQVPPPPPSNSHEQVTLPMHLLNLHPVDYEDTSSVSTFQTPRILFQPSMLAPVEKRGRTSDDRESLYDNLEVDKQEIYATVGKVSSMRKPSPDLYQGNDSLPSESGSADDSPEEEWTHF
ncbi:phospholipid-transporting ATPase ABCA1-like [Homarus americanus]|uniref:phospholipid-transporting ATPase ABCA1-like n=1 Tax=Homarus americanus TaxID=6706 RepID=UPI001C493518|nr:phospholipid-transporting ATPase ABCA1-like [Homarus americanus]